MISIDVSIPETRYALEENKIVIAYAAVNQLRFNGPCHVKAKIYLYIFIEYIVCNGGVVSDVPERGLNYFWK
jgi:hypothetical protein